MNSSGTADRHTHRDESRESSAWNLPNVLTCLRIIFVPVLAWLIVMGRGLNTSYTWWEVVIFILLMATDKLDGDIARKRGLVTSFGKIADPIADKALMITSLVCLNVCGLLPWWMTILIVLREVGITIWRFVQLRRGRVIPASKGGKVKTALQSLAVLLYLLPLVSWGLVVRYCVMVVAVIVTVVSGVQYIYDEKKAN